MAAASSAVCLVVGGALGIRMLLGAASGTPPSVHAAPGSPCIVESTKRVTPDEIVIGEETTVTQKAQFLCPGDQMPIHVALVLDSSRESAEADIRSLARSVVSALEVERSPRVRIGVAAYAAQAASLCELTSDARLVDNCLDSLYTSSDATAAIDAGLQEGLQLLLRGRAAGRDSVDEVREVMILVSARASSTGCPSVLLAADHVAAQGVLLATACASQQCDAACLRKAASQPKYYCDTSNPTPLIDALRGFLREQGASTPRQLTVRDVLTPGMVVSPDSVTPEPRFVGTTPQVIEWLIQGVPPDGVTFSYRVQPSRIGVQAVSSDTTAAFVDAEEREGDFVFPIQRVRVWPPVDGSPCQPETNSAVAPDVVDLGAELEVTLSARAACPAVGRQPEHMVLVLDASESSAAALGETMKGAAQSLVERLTLTDYPDARVGVVAYSDSSQSLCDFTRDEVAIAACIDSLQAGGDPIAHRGLDEALSMVGRAIAADSAAFEMTKLSVVLFSHGVSPAACEPLLERVGILSDFGGDVVTVCIGDACPNACLQQAATASGGNVGLDDPDALHKAVRRAWNAVPYDLAVVGGAVTERLSDKMEYVPRSATPEPAYVAADSSSFTWKVGRMSAEWHDFRYRVRPRLAGEHAVSFGAMIHITDSAGRAGTGEFLAPSAVVRGEQAPSVCLPIMWKP